MTIQIKMHMCSLCFSTHHDLALAVECESRWMGEVQYKVGDLIDFEKEQSCFNVLWSYKKLSGVVLYIDTVLNSIGEHESVYIVREVKDGVPNVEHRVVQILEHGSTRLISSYRATYKDGYAEALKKQHTVWTQADGDTEYD